MDVCAFVSEKFEHSQEISNEVKLKNLNQILESFSK